MSSQFNKAELARRNFILAGGMILTCATFLSCVSSYKLTADAWKDVGETLSKVLGMVNVLTIEGMFVWLVYGFKSTFASVTQRILGTVGVVFYGAVMGFNIIIHYRIVKGYTLNDFEQAWTSWGIAVVIITTIALATMISMADPRARSHRQSLRVEGKEHDLRWQAREIMLNSEAIEEAVEERAKLDAHDFIAGLLGDGNGDNQARFSTPAQQAAFKTKKR